MSEQLLDTHPLLWALAGDARLPAPLAAAIAAAPSRFVVSDVTFWEIGIKRSVGKLRVPDDLPRVVAELGFGATPITRSQAWSVSELPLHHRDPFDRLLIAQAADLGLPVVTADAAFAAYEVAVEWPATPGAEGPKV